MNKSLKTMKNSI